MTTESSATTRNYVLLTGASSGMGREMAIQMSREHLLILGGRDSVRLNETRQACCDPEKHIIWQFDLSLVDELAASITALFAAEKVRVSAFVHCAAVLKMLPLRSLTLEQIRDTFNTNFFSAMELTKVLMKKKINDRQLRSIVFISSIASKFGARGFSAYSASKGALDALMKSLAVELAPEVRANSVLPGGVRTSMTDRIFEDTEMAAKFEHDYPLGIGEATDIVNAVEFLISEKSRWITGQQIVVDGGRTANITA
jgi:NAD(P)-dependent dehydrogenase (short-subunit alcohol dehydrogenase family)